MIQPDTHAVRVRCSMLADAAYRLSGSLGAGAAHGYVLSDAWRLIDEMRRTQEALNAMTASSKPTSEEKRAMRKIKGAMR